MGFTSGDNIHDVQDNMAAIL